jgi:class 3 adenylate cyclase
MTAEIEAAGGTVEKFAGDAVMAAFGAPEALEDHAERALHAALAMQRRVDGLRIGVNTGEVVVGAPREGSSFVSGDAVNVAARLEQGADAGEILVGERAAAREGVVDQDVGEPFALRAQAIVTEDEALLAQAHDRFNAMRLDWHLAQTHALVELRKQAH